MPLLIISILEKLPCQIIVVKQIFMDGPERSGGRGWLRVHLVIRCGHDATPTPELRFLCCVKVEKMNIYI